MIVGTHFLMSLLSINFITNMRFAKCVTFEVTFKIAQHI